MYVFFSRCAHWKKNWNIHKHISIHMYMYIHIYKYTYVCVCVCRYIYINVFLSVCMHRNVHTSKKKHTNIFAYSHHCAHRIGIQAPKRISQTDIYIHIYIHTNFYIHICIDIYKFIYLHMYISVRVYMYVANMNIFWNTYISVYIFKHMCSQEEEVLEKDTSMCIYVCMNI